MNFNFTIFTAARLNSTFSAGALHICAKWVLLKRLLMIFSAVGVWSQEYGMCRSTGPVMNAQTQTCSVGHQSTLPWHRGLLQRLCGHLRFQQKRNSFLKDKR